MNKKIVFLLSGLLSLILFTGCGKLGYSLVLWNNPEVGVHEGQIVKVYVKSNISHSYIIMGLENTHKVEIPLWQISEPQSKSKTEKLAARYSNYEHTYANVKLDGLPIRSGTENGSKQVYRLRKNEVIRVLYQGKGVKPTNGHGELPGEWLRVLTETGTEGWCYSYNLNLFERTENQIAVKTEVVEEKIDEEITAAFSKKWYPEEYKAMLSSGRLDLSKMDESFGFDFGQVEWKYPEKSPEETSDLPLDENPDEQMEVEFPEKIPVPKVAKEGETLTFTATLRTENLDKRWTYTKIKKNEDGAYQLDDHGIYITLIGKNSLTVQYMDTDGKLKSENFVALSQNIQAAIETEIERRNLEIKSFVDEGPVYHSSNYGTIIFSEDNTAVWNNFKLLVPGVISSRAHGNIKVSVKYYLSNQLKKEFDGILTFSFEGMDEDVSFFYKKDPEGLRLEDAKKATARGNLVTARGSSPLVMYFSKNH